MHDRRKKGVKKKQGRWDMMKKDTANEMKSVDGR
jgi:hypothetical protein